MVRRNQNWISGYCAQIKLIIQGFACFVFPILQGVHLFTVPTRERTKRRVELVDGAIKHLVEPEYHSDPLNPEGILAFWDFGLDAPDVFNTEHLKLGIAAGPEGKDGRVVWEARKH